MKENKKAENKPVSKRTPAKSTSLTPSPKKDTRQSTKQSLTKSSDKDLTKSSSKTRAKVATKSSKPASSTNLKKASLKKASSPKTTKVNDKEIAKPVTKKSRSSRNHISSNPLIYGRSLTGNTNEADQYFQQISEWINQIDDYEDIPESLWLAVEWMIDNRQEKRLYNLLEDDELTDTGFDMLTFLLEDIGYRFGVTVQTKGQSGRQRITELEFIPLAIVFAALVPIDEINSIPTELPETVAHLIKEKFLRRICDIDDQHSINFDTRLYHVDHKEWGEESAVRAYIKSHFQFLTGSMADIVPLSNDYEKISLTRMINHHKEEEDKEGYVLFLRAFCATVTVEGEEEALEVEDRLFGYNRETADEKQERQSENIWQELEESIAGEIEDAGISNIPQVFIYPTPVEFWDVPKIALMMQRNISLRISMEEALDELLANHSGTEPITPSLYVSHHGNDGDIQEVRVAAYADVSSPPFFTYVWQVDPSYDEPDEIANMIIDIAGELQANMVLVNGLLPCDYCPDCGEPVFRGPVEQPAHDHGFEFLN